MAAILIVLVCVCAVLGTVIGFFRKFSKTSFWGVTVLLTLLFERLVGSAAKKGSNGYGLAVLLSTVIILVVLTAVTAALQKLLKSVDEARKTYSQYKNADDIEENEAQILNAVDNGDRREYKRYIKKAKRIKPTAGAWGLVDGILGAVSGCFNALMGVGVVLLFLLLFVDLSGIGFLNNLFSASLSSACWSGLGRKLALDLPLVSTVALSLRIGYKSGISSVVGGAVVIVLLVLFAIASFSLASSEICAGAVEGLKNGLLSGVAGSLGSAATTVARVILGLIIFLLSLIIVIIVGIFLPKIIDKFRDNKVYNAIDGVLGAVILCVLTVMLLLVFGGIAATLSDLPFMDKLNGYADAAHFGDAIYRANPMASNFAAFPLRGWFGNVAQPAE